MHINSFQWNKTDAFSEMRKLLNLLSASYSSEPIITLRQKDGCEASISWKQRSYLTPADGIKRVCMGWSEYGVFQAHQNKRLRLSALSQLKSSGNKRFCGWITAIMGTNSKCPCRGHTHTNAAQADFWGTNLQWRFTLRHDAMSSCCASQYWLASISS